MLSFGVTKGLAYRHNFLDWEREKDAQDQLDKQDEQMRMQKADWMSNQMQLGKTYTDYDRNGLQNWAHSEVLPNIAKLMQTPGAFTNPEILAKVKMLGESLKDNQYTQRSSRVMQNYELMLKDMQDAELMNDPDAKQELIARMNEYNNYNSKGNIYGLDGANVEEFTYRRPQTFDFNKWANTEAATLGTREKVYESNGLLYQDEYFANIDERVNSYLSGKDGAKLERMWQRVQSNGTVHKRKEDWLKEELKVRKDLHRAVSAAPDRSGGNGSEASGGLNYFREFVLPGLMQSKEVAIQTKAPHSTFLAGDSNYTMAQGVVRSGDDYAYTVPMNKNIAIPKADGTIQPVGSLSGRQFKISPTTEFVSYPDGSQYWKAYAMIPMQKGVTDELENLVVRTENGNDWIPWNENKVARSKRYPGMEIQLDPNDQDVVQGVKTPILIPINPAEQYNSIQQINQEFMGTNAAGKSAASDAAIQRLTSIFTSMPIGKPQVIDGEHIIRKSEKEWVNLTTNQTLKL